ncbi:MAG: glycosyltransferase family 4 protein [Planctomycetota bacterium]
MKSDQTTAQLSYLISQYPKVSHTFILREVRHLRNRGFRIDVASVNSPDRPRENLTTEEQEEADSTFFVKQGAVGKALRAGISTLIRNPIGFLSGLVYAVRLGSTDFKKILYGVFYFAEALIVGTWMRKNGSTHIHVHFATPASTVGMIAAKVFGYDFSMTVHGPDEFYDAPGYHLEEKVRRARFVCCIGTYSRSQLMKLTDHTEWDKFEVSPLGVDLSVFSPREFRPSPAPFQALCVGRLVSAKGQHILVHTMERLRDAGRNVQLRFVGDGPDRESLEQLSRDLNLSDCIRFEGSVNQDRIREFYSEADAFCLPSFAEGIPVVLMEAMSMEIPCITTHITGHHELIRNGEDGLLVSPSDHIEMASAIERLIDDEEFRRSLGEQGRRRVQSKYELTRNTDRLGDVFRNRLVDRNTKPLPLPELNQAQEPTPVQESEPVPA